jgi:hypothetical protein
MIGQPGQVVIAGIGQESTALAGQLEKAHYHPIRLLTLHHQPQCITGAQVRETRLE